MARHFPTGIDFHASLIINALLNPVSSDPTGLGTGDEGRVWYNTTADTLKFWTGTTAIDMLARANHTGTQLAVTISDFNTAVRASTLNQMTAPTADLSINSHKLTSVSDGTSASDAATKGQLDTALAALSSGQTLKGAVKVAAITNVSVSSAPASIDGISLTSGDVVLLTAQTTGSQNGPYTFSSAGAALVRATNWDTSAEAVLGSYWIVEQGTNADTFALMTNDAAITLGTDTPAFTFRGAAGASYSAGNGLSLAGTTFNVVPGLGILADGTSVRIDTSVVLRFKTGVIPTSSAGIVSVSGAAITINHGLNNAAVGVIVRAHTSPLAPYTQGQEVEFDDVSSDANNVTLTLPTAPASNNWTYMIWG